MIPTYILSPFQFHDLVEKQLLHTIYGITHAEEFPFANLHSISPTCILLLFSIHTNYTFIIKQAIDQGFLKHFILIQGSDEFLQFSTDYNELYAFKECLRVFRNHYSPCYSLNTKVITAPLCCMNNLVDAVQSDQKIDNSKHYVWSFAGDVNKLSRKEFVQVFSCISPHKIYSTSTWNDPNKLEAHSYLQLLKHSVFVICPPGNFNIDTFRFYECLEANVIPVSLECTDVQDFDYWTCLFKDFSNDINVNEICILGKTWQEALKKMKQAIATPLIAASMVRKGKVFWNFVKQKLFNLIAIEKQNLYALSKPSISLTCICMPQRKAAMQLQLNTLLKNSGIAYTLMDAVQQYEDARIQHFLGPETNYLDPICVHNMNQRGYKCFLSHKLALEQASRKNFQYTIIMEDDVALHKSDFVNIVKEMCNSQILDNYSMIMLAYLVVHPIKTLRDELQPGKIEVINTLYCDTEYCVRKSMLLEPWGLQMYILTNQKVKELVSKFTLEKHLIHAESAIMDPGPYKLYPPLGIEDYPSFHSLLGHPDNAKCYELLQNELDVTKFFTFAKQ